MNSFLFFSGLMLPLPEGLVQTLLGPSRNLPRGYACPQLLLVPKLPNAIDLVNGFCMELPCYFLPCPSCPLSPCLALLFRREIGQQGSRQNWLTSSQPQQRGLLLQDLLLGKILHFSKPQSSPLDNGIALMPPPPPGGAGLRVRWDFALQTLVVGT